MSHKERLEKVLEVVQQYLPDDGITAEQAINEIVGLVDPMPDEKTIDQHYAEFCDNWNEISKKGVDGGWRAVAWESWKKARGIND